MIRVEKSGPKLANQRARSVLLFVFGTALTALCGQAAAATWCVNAAASSGCKATIGAAVAVASPNDTITVAAGTYKESVKIGEPLSLIGGDPAKTIIDAAGLGNGIYVDGIDNSGLANVYISGFTIQNADYEGILVTNASMVTISGNIVQNNDKKINFSGPQPSCPGIPDFETGENFDCGEGIHLSGADHSTVANNTVQGNAGGILLTDDTGATHHNLISGNMVSNNPYDCGITLASHVPAAIAGSKTPLGVYQNSVAGNVSSQNGAGGDGSGVGIFTSAPGTANYGNVVSNNQLTGNSIPGVSIHGHAPGQNLNNNIIIGNTISGNGADTGDTATSGPTGINIASISPVSGIIVSQNTISQEAMDVVVRAPGEVRVLRNTLAGSIGVANQGNGTVTADGNWWGCSGNPLYLVSGLAGCSVVSGPVTVNSWLTAPFPK